MSLFHATTRRGSDTPARRPARPHYRPAVDALEGRLVLSHAAIAPHVAAAIHVAPAANVQTQATVPISVTGINLTSIQSAANGALSAVGTLTGTIAGKAFSAPISLTPASGTSPRATPVLDLHVGAIHLDLLGLKVDTSPICLRITAQGGRGNLLGNLVGNVANLLNGPNNSSLLGTVNGLLQQTVPTRGGGSSSIVGAVNTAMGSLGGSLGNVKAISHASTTQVLSLAVGPVNLNLLGLKVHLDNCSNGPVTVNVSAVAGPGNLLGNLLTDVANLLNTRGNHRLALGRDLSQILGILNNATAAAPVVTPPTTV